MRPVCSGEKESKHLYIAPQYIARMGVPFFR
jgi:hypothetical protein